VDTKLQKADILCDPQTVGKTVQKYWAILHQSNEMSDVVVAIGNEKIPSHKVVLGTWSSVFRKKLEELQPQEELKIDIKAENKELFKMVLLYMYTGTLSFVTDDAMPLLSLATQFGILPLKEQCGEALGETIRDDNVFFLLDVCEKFDCQSLRKICAKHLAEHFGRILEDTKILSLPPETVAEILRNDDIVVETEEALFKWLLSYVSQFDAAKEKKKKALETLLPTIRFPLMNPQFLVENVEGSPVGDLPLIHTLLHEAYIFRSAPARVKTERTKDRKYTVARSCKLCGTVYKERDNHNRACKRHNVNCRCATPYNYYPNPINSPNCCCSGCGAVCNDCGSCKCGSPCGTGRHAYE